MMSSNGESSMNACSNKLSEAEYWFGLMTAVGGGKISTLGDVTGGMSGDADGDAGDAGNDGGSGSGGDNGRMSQNMGVLAEAARKGQKVAERYGMQRGMESDEMSREDAGYAADAYAGMERELQGIAREIGMARGAAMMDTAQMGGQDGSETQYHIVEVARCIDEMLQIVKDRRVAMAQMAVGGYY